MDAGDWGWIWMVAFVVFLVGELATPGAFFLIGFAIGALFAMAAAFLGAAEVVQWGLFIAASVGAFAALRPLAHRMDRRSDDAPPLGATRLSGASGVLTEAAGPGGDVVGMAVGQRDVGRVDDQRVGALDRASGALCAGLRDGAAGQGDHPASDYGYAAPEE